MKWPQCMEYIPTLTGRPGSCDTCGRKRGEHAPAAAKAGAVVVAGHDVAVTLTVSPTEEGIAGSDRRAVHRVDGDEVRVDNDEHGTTVIKRHRYVELERFNLCTGRWTMGEARPAAERLLAEYHGRVLLLLGRKVATAFGHKDVPAFNIIEVALGDASRDRPTCTRLVLLPHPSGLNRMWADPQTVPRCRELLQPLCPALPLGEI